jgi:hypothetical protein
MCGEEAELKMTIKIQRSGRVLDREVNSKTIFLYSSQVNVLNMTYGTTSVPKKSCNSRQNDKHEGIRRIIFHCQRPLHQYKVTARKSKENQKFKLMKRRTTRFSYPAHFL